MNKHFPVVVGGSQNKNKLKKKIITRTTNYKKEEKLKIKPERKRINFTINNSKENKLRPTHKIKRNILAKINNNNGRILRASLGNRKKWINKNEHTHFPTAKATAHVLQTWENLRAINSKDTKDQRADRERTNGNQSLELLKKKKKTRGCDRVLGKNIFSYRLRKSQSSVDGSFCRKRIILQVFKKRILLKTNSRLDLIKNN